MSIFRNFTLAALFLSVLSLFAQDDLDTKLVPQNSPKSQGDSLNTMVRQGEGGGLLTKPPAEQSVLTAIKSPDLSVVHLWAPWCSNCQTELKNGGWLKMVKDNPQVKFYFVSVWNDGGDGKSMLQKFQIADQPNVTILADPGPRRGNNKLKQFAGMPVSWIPTTWVYKEGDLRYALNYGEVRFDVLQQFIEDSKNDWSHKGEPKLPE